MRDLRSSPSLLCPIPPRAAAIIMFRFCFLTVLFLTTTVVSANVFSFLFHQESSTSSPEASTVIPEILRCSELNGTLLPSATSCKDEASQDECDEFFAREDGVRNPRCNELILQDAALKCAKTCAICCEHPKYRCEDSRSYAFLCPSIKSTCSVGIEDVRKMMAQICPKTCGVCDLIEQ